MKLIFVKLGVGVTDYTHKRLDISMSSILIPVAILDYMNLDDGVFSALNSGTIIQITEQEYYSILLGLNIIPPTIVPTNYLITLAAYYNTCPPDNAVMFMLHGGQFYKIAWSTVKSCVGQSGLKILFRVGHVAFPAPDYPQDTDLVFQSDLLKGKIANNVHMKITGVEIYQYTDDPNVEYFVFDTVAGTITKPGGFKQGEIIDITA